VLDARLRERDWITDDYSIADIAHWSWVRIHWWADADVDDLPDLTAGWRLWRRAPLAKAVYTCPSAFAPEDVVSMAQKIIQK
jgi:glutathione S-transferase